MKKKTEEIWSANPSKCTFLLIIFFGGRPVNFEVKIMATDNSNFKSEYYVMKNKFSFSNFDSSITLSSEKSIVKKESVLNYFKKKVENPIKNISSIINASNNNKNAFKDPLNEIFELKNNLQSKSPSIINNLNKIPQQPNNFNKKPSLNQLLMNETEQSIQITETNLHNTQNKDSINTFPNDKTPTKNSIDLNDNRGKNPISNYIDQVPKNIPNLSPYNNQSNASSYIPPRAPRQQQSFESQFTQQNNAKISKLPKGEEYEQSLIFATSKGTSRVNSVAISKQIEFNDVEDIKSRKYINLENEYKETVQIINHLKSEINSKSTNNLNKNIPPKENFKRREVNQNNPVEDKRPRKC